MLVNKIRFITHDEDHAEHIIKAALFSRALRDRINRVYGLCFQPLDVIEQTLKKEISSLPTRVGVTITGDQIKDVTSFVRALAESWISYWLLYDSVSQGNIAMRIVHEAEKKGVPLSLFSDSYEGDILKKKSLDLVKNEENPERIISSLPNTRVAKKRARELGFVLDVQKRLREYNNTIFKQVGGCLFLLEKEYGIPPNFMSHLDHAIKKRIGGVPSYFLFGDSVLDKDLEGEAYVLEDPEDSPEKSSGKVLVVHATDPDYLPHVARAAGLIVERGGILSHSAILSRELGVPAVVGVEDCTSVIRTGDKIKSLDGVVYGWKAKSRRE